MSETQLIDHQKGMLHAGNLQKQGKLAEAEREYRNIISVSPEFHSAYHSLGLLAHQVGKLKVAVDSINQAIELGG